MGNITKNLIILAESTYFLAGLAGFLLYVSMSLYMDRPVTVAGSVYAFSLLQMVYLINRYMEARQDFSEHTKDRVYFIEDNSTMFVVIIIATAAVNAYLALYLGALTEMTTLGSLLLALLYSDPKICLKRFFLLKNIFPAVLFSMLPAVLLLSENPGLALTDPRLLVFTGLIFTELLINTIFYDLKDITVDSRREIKTLPAKVGEKKTIAILKMLNFARTLLIIVTAYVLIPFSYAYAIAVLSSILFAYDLLCFKLYSIGFNRKLLFGYLGDADLHVLFLFTLLLRVIFGLP